MFSAMNALELRQDAAAWFQLHKEATQIKSPYVDHIREEMGRVLVRVQIKADEKNRRELAEIFRFTIGELEKSIKKHPEDPIYHMVLGALWYGTAVVVPNEFSQGSTLGDQAYRTAITKSEERQQLYLLLSEHKIQAGEIAAGLELVKKARSFAPHSGFILKLYADYLQSARINKVEAIRMKDLALQLAPSLFDIYQAEQVGLDASKLIDGPRGVTVLRSLLACKQHNTGIACPSEFSGMPYNPNMDAFTALVKFYQAEGNNSEAERYAEMARIYFPGFVATN